MVTSMVSGNSKDCDSLATKGRKSFREEMINLLNGMLCKMITENLPFAVFSMG